MEFLTSIVILVFLIYSPMRYCDKVKDPEDDLSDRPEEPKKIAWAFSPIHLMALVEVEAEFYFHIKNYLNLPGIEPQLLRTAER